MFGGNSIFRFMVWFIRKFKQKAYIMALSPNFLTFLEHLIFICSAFKTKTI